VGGFFRFYLSFESLFVVVMDRRCENNHCNNRKQGCFMKKIKQFANLASIKKSIVISAASSLAIGIAAMIPATPAGAVILTGGELTFTGGTTNLSSLVRPSAPASFSVDYNQPAALPTVLASTGSFSSFFPQPKPALVGANITSPNTFSLVSSTPTSFLYSLNNPLSFNFGSISLNVGSGSTFTGMYNNIGGVDFSLLSSVGSTFVTTSDSVATQIQSLNFSFGDTGLSGIGTYRISASPTSVPEPFSVIGTIVGGTAAFRMRKKLANINKN
jgi:hypothetical protein